MKRRLVRALGEQGHTVAMTGDGVNDILAFREADCSIAMASGSAAARNIAEIVLADSDFSHLPNVVAEGRRSINNLQRSAALFLMKTVYTAALTFVCIVVPPYPFIPIQMSLISTAIIGSLRSYLRSSRTTTASAATSSRTSLRGPCPLPSPPSSR